MGFALTESVEDSGDLPLFPNLLSYGLASNDVSTSFFSDPFLNDLVSCDAFQRLRSVGFLGAIDYAKRPSGPEPHRRRHNRYDHSLGVSHLALSYARDCGLDQRTTRILASAGLLHDIGHSSLSHSLEPVFECEYGMTHHEMGRNIVYGRERLGRRIPDIMSRYGVDLDEVVSMIDGVHTGEHSHLFSSPINFDTFEGMNRTIIFFTNVYRSWSPYNLVSEIAQSSSLPIGSIDSFWSLKNDIYSFFIDDSSKVILDGVVKAYFATCVDYFSPEYFLKTDEQLRESYPDLFHIFDVINNMLPMRQTYHQLDAFESSSPRKSNSGILDLIESSILDYELDVASRSFEVDSAVSVNSPADLKDRYIQVKSTRRTTIGELLRH